MIRKKYREFRPCSINKFIEKIPISFFRPYQGSFVIWSYIKSKTFAVQAVALEYICYDVIY